MQNYILEGGFPRTILLENMAAKRRYVQSVIDEIFEKDIRRRLKIRNKSTFETVQKYIINNFGATTSLKSLKKAIEHSMRISRRQGSRCLHPLFLYSA